MHLAADLRTLSVRACFAGASPERLRAGDDAAARYLIETRWDDETSPAARVRGDRMRLLSAPAGRCINYRVNVGAAADDRSLRRSAWVGDDLLTTPEIWLWRPPGALALRFDLPPGIDVSSPWPRRDDGAHLAGATPVGWAAIVAFGRLAQYDLDDSGRGTRVALVDPGRFEDAGDMRAWIGETVDAVATVHGRFPRAGTQVLVVPSMSGGGPVPWGQVLRGGAPAVHFFVNPARTLEEFRADWTASHELSHLLLPYVRRADAWLSEGVASYYQNVARGRAGLLDPAEAWHKLSQGFGRGIAGTDARRTLRDASRGMRRNGDYMRVYWSGAAIALLADTALRQRHDDAPGLDTALGRLADCCLDVDESWSAAGLLAQLDTLMDTDIFTNLHDAHIDAGRFPDIAPTLRQLGIVTVDGTVQLDDDAPLAHIRRAIMKPATTPLR